MKPINNFLIAATMVAISGVSASAATISREEIWKNGSEVMGKAIKEKKMENILNPIICAIPETGEIALIYSEGFRQKDTAYLNDPHGGLVPIAKSLIGIEYIGSSPDGGPFKQFQIKLIHARNVELTCVTPAGGLE